MLRSLLAIKSGWLTTPNPLGSGVRLMLTREAIEAQLNRLLESQEFAESPRLRAFLVFTIHAQLENKDDDLKEYSIGREVFDLPESFDTSKSSTVRSAANRLRKKLRKYYETEGQSDPLCIEYPEGHYTPRFRSVGEERHLRPEEPSKPKNQLWPMLIAVVVGLLLITGVSKVLLGRFSSPGAEAIVATTALSYPDREVSPSFSPDGKQVAFHSNGGTHALPSIYKRTLGGVTVQLTDGSTDDRNPCWSPDGSLIAFIRDSGPHGSVYVMDEQGKHLRKLTDTSGFAIAWFPDSRYVAILDRKDEMHSYEIVIVEVATGARQTLTPAMIDPWADHILGFSPDGQALAFMNHKQLWTLEIERKGPRFTAHGMRLLEADNLECYGFAWMPDGREILLSADRQGGPNIWLVSRAHSSQPTPLQFLGDHALRPALSFASEHNSLRLAFENFVSRVNIWQIHLSADKRVTEKPTRFVPSKRKELAPQFSSDMREVAFSSLNAEGNFEIFTADADGSNPIALPTGVRHAGSARWSPDGFHIAFDSLGGENYDVFTIEPRTGKVKRLTSGASTHVRPSWSRDGKWIYFGSDRAKKGVSQIWKIQSDGGGMPRQVTVGGGFEGFESWDGKSLYYTRSIDAPGLWKVSPDGGDEILVLDAVREGFWSVAEDGIYFVNFGTAERSRSIEYYSFSTGRSQVIYRADADATHTIPGFAVSRNGRSLLISLLENQSSEITVIDPFEPKVLSSSRH